MTTSTRLLLFLSSPDAGLCVLTSSSSRADTRSFTTSSRRCNVMLQTLVGTHFLALSFVGFDHADVGSRCSRGPVLRAVVLFFLGFVRSIGAHLGFGVGLYHHSHCNVQDSVPSFRITLCASCSSSIARGMVSDAADERITTPVRSAITTVHTARPITP